MVHTGHDTSMTIAGVYEKRLYARSRDINVPYYESKSLPIYDCGAVMTAWTQNEVDKLPGLVVAAHRNGVTGVRQISREDVIRMEPHINKAVLGGIFVPGECVVDPFLTPITMLHEATRSGAHVRVDSKVEDGKYLDDTWVLQTRNGIVKARVVVNAAGLYGDKVENMCRPSRFTITPGKGEAVVYPKDVKKLINHMILQIPTPKTKGIIIYPTVYGNVIIGPTLEYVTDREIPPENPKVIETLVKFGHRIIPSLKEYKPIGSVVGLRPGTEQRDYHLEALPDKRWVTVGGIRATGLTNCLSIAEYVSHEIINTIGVSPSRNKPASPGKATWWKTNKGTIVMDGIEYTVTHPITKFGLWDTAKSAQLLKSKL